MVHPYANPAGYMSASRDTISSQGHGKKRGDDCRPPRRKRFSALSFMNMRNSKDLSSPAGRPSPATTVPSPTSTIVAPSPAHSRAPSVTRSRAPPESRSCAPSAPSAIVSTPQSVMSTPPSTVRKPSSSSRRGRDPPFIVKSSQHCTFEVALPAKTRGDGVHSRTARSGPRATARHEQSSTGSRYEGSTMRQDQSRTTRSVAARIARVPPPSITQVPPPAVTRVPSTTRRSPPSTAGSSPPSTARSTTVYGSSTAIYSSPSTARSSPTLVSTPVRAANHANASSPDLSSAGSDSATTWHPVANPHPATDPIPHLDHTVASHHSTAPTTAANAHTYPDDTWSFFTPPTPAVPRFSFNWHGQPGRRGRMKVYGAQVKHYGVRVKHSMNGARARQIKGKVATSYCKAKARGRVWERQIAVRAVFDLSFSFQKQRLLIIK
ncbi:hypothetical protein EV121DRAFT_213730 [Schizophyllum commune]